ncbi:hypothetical protein [Cohnella massiliensis]|uniref:hypothetical protein n=1 Tax=Cohnella massiliensis TaxID=1816691 RepID=UPI0009BADDDE|nr:hypothetical protein [Cohnella massiliensis]
MKRDIWKLSIVAALLVLAMMYGMELASSGISNVYGPLEGEEIRSGEAGETVPDPETAPEEARERAERTEEGTPAGQRYADEPPGIAYDSEAEPTIPRNDSEPVVDRLAGKTAETLQQLSKSGIRFIVSLFDQATE